MSIHDDTRALARCCLRCSQSDDGRTHHGALVKATNELVLNGANPLLATLCAMAAVRVGEHIRMVVSRSN
jgi:methylphosphotriester-DNA--protein-cysteine methyltransferase